MLPSSLEVLDACGKPCCSHFQLVTLVGLILQSHTNSGKRKHEISSSVGSGAAV